MTRRKQVVCRCDLYRFPHRLDADQCEPEPDVLDELAHVDPDAYAKVRERMDDGDDLSELVADDNRERAADVRATWGHG